MMALAARIRIANQSGGEAVEVVVPADAVVGGEVGDAHAVGEDEQGFGGAGEEFDGDYVSGLSPK
jgi:hypothetical protein